MTLLSYTLLTVQMLSVQLGIRLLIFIIILNYFFQFMMNIGLLQGNGLRQVTSCVCSGCELVFECTVEDGSATVWQGSVFNGCQNNKTILRRTSTLMINQTCGTRRPISAYITSVTNESVTSRLTVWLIQEINDSKVQCANESGHIFGETYIELPSGIVIKIKI